MYRSKVFKIHNVQSTSCHNTRFYTSQHYKFEESFGSFWYIIPFSSVPVDSLKSTRYFKKVLKKRAVLTLIRTNRSYDQWSFDQASLNTKCVQPHQVPPSLIYINLTSRLHAPLTKMSKLININNFIEFKNSLLKLQTDIQKLFLFTTMAPILMNNTVKPISIRKKILYDFSIKSTNLYWNIFLLTILY